MVKVPTWVVFIVRTIRVYPLSRLNVTGTWSAPDWIFLRCAPFVSYPFCPRSSPSNGIINGLAGGLATSRERDWVGYNRERIKYGCADLPRQEVAFPRKMACTRFFEFNVDGWLNIHHLSLTLFLPFSVLSISFPLFLPPSSDHSSYMSNMSRSWRCLHVKNIFWIKSFVLEKEMQKSLIEKYHIVNHNCTK